MKYRLQLFLLALATFSAAASANMDAVMAEQNLEKRSDLALQYADQKLSSAKTAYVDGDYAAFRTGMQEFTDAVELSYKSLDSSGKKARRSPKYFKRAEKNVRKLLSRLQTLETDVGLDDRTPVRSAAKRLNEIHDQLVLDIMTKK